MTVSREAINAVVMEWNRKAKSELFMDEWLHPVAKQWLIEAIESIHAQSAPESSEVEQSRAESNRTRKKGH